MHAIETRHRRHAGPRELAGDRLPAGVRKGFKALVWATVGLLAVYGLAKASATVLLTLGAIVLGLLGLATCVCLYALNNTRF
jgi:hypothetical protein